MATLTVLLGLCGSGKTHLSDQLEEETGAKVFEKVIGNNQCEELVRCLESGKDCIVEEVYYCIPSLRAKLIQSLAEIEGLQIRWICFENDLESANWNVERRTNKTDVATHKRINQDDLHPRYTYPAGARIIPIYRI